MESAVNPPNMNTISRAQFLRGDWRGRKPELRPPWALPESLFVEVCDGCGLCIKDCPQKILQLDRGLPKLDFSQGECTFCADCLDACPHGALRRPAGLMPKSEQNAWSYCAAISSNCLAINGTSCVRCVESCAHEAIVARPALGGRHELSINHTSCNGCGACVAGCPVSAINIQFSSPEPVSEHELSRRSQ